jgi:clan AA aspartic protease
VIGHVDNRGRALLVLSVRATRNAEPMDLTVWIDTAFTGELVIPRTTISAMDLPQSAAVMAGLADGTQVVLESYSCVIDRFGDLRLVEVIENDGEMPLLGVGLLNDRRLEVDYRKRSLVLD